MLNIVFMGTPDFAVPALRALHKHGHQVDLVITQPDRRKGRGRKLALPPVKTAALELGLTVAQPDTIRNPQFHQKMQTLAPDLFVVVAFGHILSRTLLDIPRLGAINVHASLLPKYRGPAPIQWALLDREKQTGVTTMFLDTGVDTGDMLHKAATTITPQDTAATLHDRLAELGGTVLIETLQALEAKTLTPQPQDHNQATHAPLLQKQDGRINWQDSAEAIEARVRAMTPWPGAFTKFNDKPLKIHRAQIVNRQTDAKPGSVLTSFPDELWVATGQGVLSILELQGASGKRLKAKEFLCGCKMAAGTCLG